MNRFWRPSQRSVAKSIACRASIAGLLLAPFVLGGCNDAGTGLSLSATSDAGPSPFISMVHLTGFDGDSVTSVQYTIEPKPGTISKPVRVEYSMAALKARGDVSAGTVTVPVIGLYAGYDNKVSMDVTVASGDLVQLEVDITTPKYVDPTGIYSQLKILAKRPSDSSLGYSFIYLKSALGSPIIVDTDGNIRWADPAAGIITSFTSTFDAASGSFIIGSEQAPFVYRLGLDGALTRMSLPAGGAGGVYTNFEHDISHGKQGLLASPDVTISGVQHLLSNLIEMQLGTTTVTVLNHWGVGTILKNYMTSQGDDAGAFVRPGADWFHLNSEVYDPANDSVIISGREDFVIDLDYNTGAINWILGDPTKYWYTFPSLRAKALTLAPGGLYPIGQHALSITQDGNLMLFNDGQGSTNQPVGKPAGETRTYSAVSVYSIDPAAMTATNLWNYDAGQQIFSPYCGSAYQQPDKSILIDYAVAEDDQKTLIVGLDADHNIVFEFQYPNTVSSVGVLCKTSWNARPFALDDLQITR